MNYDSRELAKLRRWWTKIDAGRMRATTIPLDLDDEQGEVEHEVPIHFEVCESCRGAGKYVNPSIDSHGLSSEEMSEDPDFAEDYFSGTYDVRCEECRGERVIPICDDLKVTAEIGRLIQYHINSMAEYAAERRMGA